MMDNHELTRVDNGNIFINGSKSHNWKHNNHIISMIMFLDEYIIIFITNPNRVTMQLTRMTMSRMIHLDKLGALSPGQRRNPWKSPTTGGQWGSIPTRVFPDPSARNAKKRDSDLGQRSHSWSRSSIAGPFFWSNLEMHTEPPTERPLKTGSTNFWGPTLEDHLSGSLVAAADPAGSPRWHGHGTMFWAYHGVPYALGNTHVVHSCIYTL